VAKITNNDYQFLILFFLGRNKKPRTIEGTGLLNVVLRLA